MESFEDKPLASWLERFVKFIFEEKPESIAVAARLPNGTTMTGYYKAEVDDKAMMAHNIYSDAILEMTVNNARIIKDSIEELDEDDDEEEEN